MVRPFHTNPDVRWTAERVDEVRALLAGSTRALADWMARVRQEVATASGVA